MESTTEASGRSGCRLFAVGAPHWDGLSSSALQHIIEEAVPTVIKQRFPSGASSLQHAAGVPAPEDAMPACDEEPLHAVSYSAGPASASAVGPDMTTVAHFDGYTVVSSAPPLCSSGSVHDTVRAWCTAFLRFACTYIASHPSDAASQLRHMQQVSQLNVPGLGTAWRELDEPFS